MHEGLEAMKASAKTAREANETLTVEIETLKAELNAAQRKVTSTSDVVSSEVQALEEENIELLKENKELRVQVSRLKAGQSSAAAPSTSVFASQSECNSVANTPARVDTLSGCLSGQKRAFGTDISNTVPSSAVKTATSAADVIKPTHTAASDVSTTTAAAEEGAVGNTRRTRTKVGTKAVKATAQVPDEAAECKQS